MSQVLEQPVNQTEFFDTPPFREPEVTAEMKTPRYLFFIGNTVDPDRALELDYLRGGGIEVSNPCLKFTRQFIRRCRVTPLISNIHDPLPREMLGDNSANTNIFPIRAQRPDPNVNVLGGGLEPPMITEAGPLMGWMAFPGYQIGLILDASPNLHRNMRRGIVELGALKGHDYQLKNLGNGINFDPEIWAIQKAIFPDYPTIPTPLSDVMGLINTARQSNTGIIKTVAEQMLISGEQFERWAKGMIDRVHRLMKMGAMESGEVHGYNGIELVLLEQLGIPRQDDELKSLAGQTRQFMQAVGASQGNATNMTEIMRLFNEASERQQETFLDALKVLKATPPPRLKSLIRRQPKTNGEQEKPDEMMAEPEVLTNETPDDMENMAQAMADTEQTEEQE